MTGSGAKFADRPAAGQALAHELTKRRYADPVVLALPRGGVPVAFEVAKVLQAPLDLVMVRKLGAPGHAEYAIGAVVDGTQPHVVLDKRIVDLVGASETYIDNAKASALAEIERRRALYGVREALSLSGKTAIVVDDGIATGSTVRAALNAIRNARPARIVLAVPVAPQDSLAEISQLCDEVVCLMQPRPFYAVGAHYADFGQTSDADVITLLAKAREAFAAARP